MTWCWLGRKLEITVDQWAFGIGGGLLTEKIRTVCGPRRRIYLGINAASWQLTVTYWGKCENA